MPGKYIFISDLPKKLDTSTGYVKVLDGARCQGYLSFNKVLGKQKLKSAILDNKESSTGFFICISGYCISCVFQWHARGALSYVVLVLNDSKPTHVPKVFSE